MVTVTAAVAMVTAAAMAVVSSLSRSVASGTEGSFRKRLAVSLQSAVPPSLVSDPPEERGMQLRMHQCLDDLCRHPSFRKMDSR